MSTRDDGGPAFPHVAELVEHDLNSITTRQITNGGMSLRDYFAAAALANPYTHCDNNPDKVAEWAYHVAAAMIAVRGSKCTQK